MSLRETRVLAAIAEGKTSAEIARLLSIRETTVKFHLNRVFSQLGARNRTHAVAIAFRLRVLQ